MGLCRYLPTPSDRMGILWSLLAIEDSVIVEYGPAGTTHFSMSLFGELGVDQQNRLFTTHMSEDDVVMGDVSRLEKSLVEVDQGYRPRVIFVVASSVSAVIGTDLQGVCAYMQEKVDARLIAFEQGGFRGDYSAGIQAAYRLLAEDVAEADVPRNAGTYNILGASAGSFRMESDVREIERLMREAFGMELNACLCLDTSVEKIQRMGCAEINLALCEEAVPAARILNQKCGTPFLTGAPYGYAGTLAWLEKIGRQLGREAAPVLRAALKKRAAEAMQYRMYGMMLKADKPQVAIFGDAPTVAGLSSFMDELGFPVVAAHFFVFYFGIVADITPPVALAAYAGSAIAKSNPMKTGINATKLAIAAFIVPYIFAYSPALLFENISGWWEVAQITVSALLGIFAIAASLNGFLYKKIHWVLRLVLAIGGLGMMIPGTLTDVVGLALVAAVIVYQKLRAKKNSAPQVIE